MLYFANNEVPRCLNGKMNPLFVRLGRIAANYTKSYSKAQKLALPSDTWSAFIRKEPGPDYHLFLSNAGQEKTAQDFAHQMMMDRRAYPDLHAPPKAQIIQWMRNNIEGLRFDLIPPEIAQVVQRGLQKSLTEEPDAAP